MAAKILVMTPPELFRRESDATLLIPKVAKKSARFHQEELYESLKFCSEVFRKTLHGGVFVE
jgi:hypothetical protein